MPDWEDVNVGGTIHIRFSSGTGTSTGFTWSATFGSSTRQPPPQPRPTPPPMVWDPIRAKRLYRAMSKRFHPDLATELIDGHTPERWMKELNRVMDLQRMDVLVRMAERYCPDSVNG